MSASGILRSDKVVFYHPLDDFEEHTQSQVWTGSSAFTPGKIGQAESAISADTPTFGSGVTIDIPQFGSPLQTNHSLRRIDDSRLLLSYVDSTTGPDNYDPVVRVVTVSGTSGIFGTSQTLEASWGNTKHDCPILTMMNESSGIAWYWTDGFRAAARVVQISGTTITLGDQYNNETEFCYVPLDIEAVDSDKAITAWEYNGDYFVNIVSMSGTTLTYGSSLNVQGAGSGTAWIRLTKLDANTAAMVRYNDGNMYGTILTQSGTTVTAGPTTIITSGNVTVHISAREAIGLTSDKFVAFCQKNSLHPGYTGPFATVCEVSGTNITVGSTILFETSGSALIATSKLSSDSIFVDRSPSNVRILTVSGTSGTFGGVGTHPITRVAPGLAAETLTSNTVVVVHSEQTGSPWPIEMAVGIIDLAASMTASSGGAYPSTSGNDRIMVAAWVKNITPGSSTATIERGYKIDVTATSISLGGTTAVWNDADILSLMSTTGLNDGSSHLFVMNFENTSGNNWNLKTSVDGVSWVDQGVQNSGTQVIVTIDTLPNVSIEDGESGQWIDELVLWAGDKATFNEFTSQELTNLYNLADMYDKPMNEYEEGPFFLSSSIDLYVFAITNASVDLYLQAPSFINASSNLFLQADVSHSASGDLFIWGRDTRFCLYSDNVVFYHPVDDYTEATLEEPWQENVVEFSSGILVSGAMATSGSDTFIVYDNQAGGYPSLGGVTSIAIAFWSKDFFRAGLDASLFVGNSSSPTSRADENGIHLHTNNKPMVHVSGVGGQSVRSIESIPNDGEWHFVIIYAEVSGGQWRIYESTDDAPSMKLSTNDSTSALQMGDQRYFMIHLENPDEAVIDEIICWTGLSQPFTRDEITTLYTLASLHGLKMNQSSDHFDITGDKDLFINGHISNVDSGNLFIRGNESNTNLLDLFTNGHLNTIASGDLYVLSHQNIVNSGGLFLEGHINPIASGDLFIDGHNTTFEFMSLFAFAPPPNLYDLTTLYTIGLDSATISGDLFIHGYTSVEVSDDLYTYGHDNYVASGNLFVDGIDQRAIYWVDSDSNKIQRSSLDGSNIEDIIDTDLPLVQSLVINSATNQIYFGDSITDKIELSDSNGVNREDIVTTDLQGIRGITISDFLQKIYWTDTELNVIKRCNLDGSSVETIVSLGTASILQKISIHDGEGKMYWTDEELGSPTIKKANLDGTNIQTIMSTGLNQPREISVDTINNKVYWVDAINDSVDRMDLDGNNRVNLATINGPQAIAIDTFGQKLYVGNLIGKIYSLDLDGSNKTEIADTSGVIRAIDFGFTDYVPAIIDEISLFIYGYDITFASDDLFINGYEHTAVSGNLFIDGGAFVSGTMALFTFGPPPDIYNTTVLYMAGEAESLAKPIDWLLKSSDHNPQIIGTIDGATSVNIQLWEITNGQNIAVIVASSGCYQIGNTGRWAWSTSGLPTYTTRQRQYFYLMAANNNETFAGQFFLELPESARWIHPSDRNEYLI